MHILALRYLILTPFLFICAIAWADSVNNNVDLVCNAKANLALVRFSISDSEPRIYSKLPPELDHGLSASTGSGRTNCTLANGTTVRVRSGQEQAFAYGAGGASPPAFFSMWINQRKVFSRQVWMPGNADLSNNLPTYDGVLITATHITTCVTAESTPQRCTREPLDLAHAPIDHVEYGFNAGKTPLGEIVITAHGAAEQRFCRAYVGLIQSKTKQVFNGAQTPFDLDLAKLFKNNSDAPFERSGLVDLVPGVTRRLMMWESSDHYFDGTVIALVPSDAIAKDIIATYRLKDIEVWPKRQPPPTVTLISGGQKHLYPHVSPRYVHLVPQRIDGSLYILAYPTNQMERPTAVLVKPLDNGGFTNICSFNRTGPNY